MWKRTSNMVSQSFFMMMVMFSLTGCFEEKIERWLNKETYAFVGQYENQYNKNTIEFRDAMASINIVVNDKTKSIRVPFHVEGNLLYMKVKNNSKEKRPDIVMRIHGRGEVLTCAACPMHKLSNVWIRREMSLPGLSDQLPPSVAPLVQPAPPSEAPTTQP